MTDHPRDDAQLPALEREAYDAYRPPAPSDALVERIVAALPQPGSQPRSQPGSQPGRVVRIRAWLAIAAVAIAALGSALWLVQDARHPGEVRGSVVAARAQHLPIGPRATASVERGARLRWAGTVEALQVEQTSGAVRYRVQPTRSFIVNTPVGAVSVVGTDFRVEVMQNTTKRRTAKIAAAVVVTVAVYQGAVLLSNSHGEAKVRANQRATITKGATPRVTEQPASPDRATPRAIRRRIDANARQRLLDTIRGLQQKRERTAAAAPAATPTPPAATPSQPDERPISHAEARRAFEAWRPYITAAMDEVKPLLRECYELTFAGRALDRMKVVVRFGIIGEPEAGGIVDEAEVSTPDGTVLPAVFGECLRETVYSIEFVPPPTGKRITVNYPFEFTPGEPEP